MPKEILIVDDEPDVVVPIHFLMEQQCYFVMVAERGEDAWIGFINTSRIS